MHVERLYLSPERGSAQRPCRQLSLLAGQGVAGDRHCGRSDWPGQNLTLIEAEEIEEFCNVTGRPVDLSLSRRNIVTRGIRLNELVGKRFYIGECELLGVELCEPCRTLGQRLENASLSGPEVVRYWLGRGGLRADVLRGCKLIVGDALRLPESLT